MKQIIFSLRNQTEEVRRHILYVATFVLAVMMFFVWAYTLSTGSSEEIITEENVETEQNIKSDSYLLNETE